MEPWQVAVALVASLVVGAGIPLVVQASLTLRGLRRAGATLEREGAEAFAAVGAASRRLERIAARIEDERHLDLLLEGIDSLSLTVIQLQDTVRVASRLGAAIAPAVGAAVKAWRSVPANGAAAAESKAPDNAGGTPEEE